MTKAFCSVALVMLGFALQSCGIPDLVTKKADVPLPGSYGTASETTGNTGSMKWKQFFADPKLAALIDVAVANNKEVNMALQRISFAENEIQARRGAYLPFVTVGASVGGEKPGTYTFAGAVEEGLNLPNGQPFPSFVSNYQFGLSSTWEIDIWKKLRNATQVAILEYMASWEGRNFLLTNLVSEVAHAYYEIVALDNQLENVDQYIKILEKGLDMVKQLQIFARTSTLAVKRYEAEVAKNQSRRFEILQQIVVVENRLNFLLGRTPRPIERNSMDFMDGKPKILNVGIPSQLLRNRPDIRQAEFELAAAELDIDVARANFYPSFGIRAGIGYDAFLLKYLINTPESLAAMVAGELVAPLVNKQAIIAEFRNANAKQIQAAYEYEQRIINAVAEVANQISNVDKLEKNYQRKSQQVGALVESIDVAVQLFKNARTDYLDVLLTQRDSLDAKRELIETKERQYFAMVDLYKSLGGGWR